MARFDRYMLSQLMLSFGVFALILVAVYWVNRAVRLFDQLISDGQSALVVLEFTLLTLPNVILVVLPVAVFIAALVVTNRLTADSEMVVLQSTGLSAGRLLRPAMMFGLLVGLLMSLLAHVLVPISHTTLAERQSEVARDVTARVLTEGRFMHPTKGVTVFIGEITPNGELLEVFLSDARADGAETIYTAEKALLVATETGPRLVMLDGVSQTLRADGQRLATVGFSDFGYNLGGLAGATGPRAIETEERSTAALLAARDADLTESGATRAVFLAEGHGRFAKPLMAIAVAMIGVGALLVGGYSRFGLIRQIFLAVLLIIAVQALDTTAESTAREDAGKWALVYLGPVTGILLSLALVWLANRPALFVRHETPDTLQKEAPA